MPRLENLVGQTYGLLVVQKRAPNGPRSCTVWECLCSCGRVVLRKATSLKRCFNHSCGCGRREARSYLVKDITGHRFGKLVASGTYEKRGPRKHIYWLFRCDCGNDKFIYKNSVARGGVISCGCHWARGRKQRSAEELMWYSVRSRARSSGVLFDLHVSDITIPDVCPVFGIKLKKNVLFSGEDSPSLDRIVPSGGYVRGNVSVISQRANRLKSDMTLGEVQKLASYIENTRRFSVVKASITVLR